MNNTLDSFSTFRSYDEHTRTHIHSHTNNNRQICQMIISIYRPTEKGILMQQHVSYRVRKLLRFGVFDEWAIYKYTA